MAAQYHVGSCISAVKQGSDGNLFYWNAAGIAQASAAYARALAISASANIVSEDIGMTYAAESVDISPRAVNYTFEAKRDVVINEVWAVFLAQGGEAAIRELAKWRAKARSLNAQTNTLFASVSESNNRLLSELDRKITVASGVRDFAATAGFGVACAFAAPAAAAAFLLGRAGGKIQQGVMEKGAQSYFNSGAFGGVIIETAADAVFGFVGGSGAVSGLKNKILVMVIPKIPITVGQGLVEGKTRGQIGVSVFFDALGPIADVGLDKLLSKLVPTLSKANILAQAATATGRAPSTRVAAARGAGGVVSAAYGGAVETTKTAAGDAAGTGGGMFDFSLATKTVRHFANLIDSSGSDDSFIRTKLIIPRGRHG